MGQGQRSQIQQANECVKMSIAFEIIQIGKPNSHGICRISLALEAYNELSRECEGGVVFCAPDPILPNQILLFSHAHWADVVLSSLKREPSTDPVERVRTGLVNQWTAFSYDSEGLSISSEMLLSVGIKGSAILEGSNGFYSLKVNDGSFVGHTDANTCVYDSGFIFVIISKGELVIPRAYLGLNVLVFDADTFEVTMHHENSTVLAPPSIMLKDAIAIVNRPSAVLGVVFDISNSYHVDIVSRVIQTISNSIKPIGVFLAPYEREKMPGKIKSQKLENLLEVANGYLELTSISEAPIKFRALHDYVKFPGAICVDIFDMMMCLRHSKLIHYATGSCDTEDRVAIATLDAAEDLLKSGPFINVVALMSGQDLTLSDYSLATDIIEEKLCEFNSFLAATVYNLPRLAESNTFEIHIYASKECPDNRWGFQRYQIDPLSAEDLPKWMLKAFSS